MTAREPEFTINGSEDEDEEAVNDNNNSNKNGPSSASALPGPAAAAASVGDQLDPSNSVRSNYGPTGTWSEPRLFLGCCRSFFTPLFWMAWCCLPCLYGQLMQRLGLTCSGLPTFHERARDGRPRQSTEGTCLTVTIFGILATFCFLYIGGFTDILFYVFCFYVLFMGMLLRSVIRKYFGIGPLQPRCLGMYDGLVEDCLISSFCCCCSGIQMARHTHNEHKYPYNPCSNNGLPSYAPELWRLHDMAFLEDDNPQDDHQDRNTTTTTSTAAASTTTTDDNNNNNDNMELVEII